MLQVQASDSATYIGGNDGRLYLWIAMSVGVLALLAAGLLARSVIAQDTGTVEMQVISNAIREGAEAFLKRQYRTIGVIAVALAFVVFFGYHLSARTAPFALRTVVSFLVGATCSGLAGFTGMYVSIRANIRTAAAARSSLNLALQMALRGGAVTGLVVVALSLLGVGALFLFFGGLTNPQGVPYQLVGFGFGASLVALFAQLGGGIYTKAADVGADLVGKVEAGIPEDDPRNPAVIADLVGDNVGDCAGRGADIFESTAAENVGAMILGAALYPVFGVKGILFPLIVHAINLIASIVGVAVVKATETEDPMMALNRGFYLTSVLALAGFAVAVRAMLSGPGVAWLYLLGCGVVGLVTAFLFVWITQYYTEARYRPVKSIAEASLTGPATNIIAGLAVGMETPAIPVLVISSALLLSYYLGVQGLAGVSGVTDYAKGIYGTAIATMGMLSCAAYILAMDTFGPITDNAGGIIEMSNQPVTIRERTDKLDAAGNTTKALTKGYAIGSASLAAFLLFSAYLEEIRAIVTDKVSLAGGYMP
ncbi:MAG: sodium-translocating pyrophosphatase, partial [Mycobacterium sp.]